MQHCASAMRNTFLEALYPTRCIGCDLPGTLLCKPCSGSIDFIDQGLACKRCGAPFGSITCTECVCPGSVDHAGRLMPLPYPFAAARAFCVYEGIGKKIITGYKDQGERRLDRFIARGICHAVQAPVLDWTPLIDALATIPANPAHARARGFDHMDCVADLCSQRLGIPFIHPLQSTSASDQRRLSQRERMQNRFGSFSVSIGNLPPTVLLIDDVFTTGSTLSAATHALLKGGACRVLVAVFARVW